MYTSWAHGSLGGSFASGFAESLGLMEFKGFRVYILRPEDIVPGYMDPIRVSSKKRHQHRKGGGERVLRGDWETWTAILVLQRLGFRF